jgi:hypothetical protein
MYSELSLLQGMAKDLRSGMHVGQVSKALRINQAVWLL